MSKLPFDKQVAMEVLFTGHGPDTFKGIIHNLSRSRLPNLILENAEMPSVILDESDLKKARLKGSNLRGARLVLADLRGADLTYADLRDCLLFNTNLAGAILIGADLRGANLTRANLQGVNLQNVKLDDSEQLTMADSLYEAILPDWIESEFKTRNRWLFRKPEMAGDDPNYISE